MNKTALQGEILKLIPHSRFKQISDELNTSKGYVSHVIHNLKNPKGNKAKKIIQQIGAEAALNLWVKSWEEME